MKKIMSAAAAAAVLSSLAVNAFAESGTLGNLLVLGDSITSGYGLEGYIDGDNTSANDSFANLLAESDLFDGENYDNFAVDGRTSAELLEAISADETYRSKIADADEIVISIGGNDFLVPMLTAMQTAMMADQELMHSIMNGSMSMEEIASTMYERFSGAIIEAIDGVDLDKTNENISNIFESIYQLNENCDVYILTVYDPFDVEGESADMLSELKDTAETKLSLFNDGIRTAADEYENVHVVDVFDGFKGNTEVYTNISKGDIHPSKDGHKVIYEMIRAAMIENSGSDVTEDEDIEEEEYESDEEVTDEPSEEEYFDEDTAETEGSDTAEETAAAVEASTDETVSAETVSEETEPAAPETDTAEQPLPASDNTASSDAPADNAPAVTEVAEPPAPASDSSSANAPTGNVPAEAFSAAAVISLAAILISSKKHKN